MYMGLNDNVTVEDKSDGVFRKWLGVSFGPSADRAFAFLVPGFILFSIASVLLGILYIQVLYESDVRVMPNEYESSLIYLLFLCANIMNATAAFFMTKAMLELSLSALYRSVIFVLVLPIAYFAVLSTLHFLVFIYANGIPSDSPKDFFGFNQDTYAITFMTFIPIQAFIYALMIGIGAPSR